jgi:cyclic beta-1,2-glucan synthetase
VLERAARVRWPWRTAIERGIRRFPADVLCGRDRALTLLATSGSCSRRMRWKCRDGNCWVSPCVFLLCASQLAVALMNWLSTLLVKPRRLPRLDYSSGIASDCRTMVVVPTMLTSLEGVDRLIETLEIHHLANRDPHLHFACSRISAMRPRRCCRGSSVAQRARAGVEWLNPSMRIRAAGPLLPVPPAAPLEPGEGLWMGYERKRGKLMEFNALLRGGSRMLFRDRGATAILPAIKYVITLDTDTQLPRDAARQLVGTMAHPLNRPEFDPARGIVTEGYSILQPRVGVSLPSARRSWFVRLFAGDAGIDPYTREVSDVYQDVFQEGSFIGKGSTMWMPFSGP